MSGDDFGPDAWPHDQPAADDHGESGATGSAAHEHLSGGDEPEPGAGVNEYDPADGASAVPDVDQGIEVGPHFDGLEEPDAVDPSFDAAGPDHFDAEADAAIGHVEETPAPSGSQDHWAAAIGPGAVDPAGTQAGVFDQLDLSSPDRAGHDVHDAEPEWLTEELASARSTWVDPSLLEASGAPEASSLFRSSGEEAVAGLWARLAPETPMPPDVTEALDALAARARTTSLGQVVEAARRLLDG